MLPFAYTMNWVRILSSHSMLIISIWKIKMNIQILNNDSFDYTKWLYTLCVQSYCILRIRDHAHYNNKISWEYFIDNPHIKKIIHKSKRSSSYASSFTYHFISAFLSIRLRYYMSIISWNSWQWIFLVSWERYSRPPIYSWLPWLNYYFVAWCPHYSRTNVWGT